MRSYMFTILFDDGEVDYFLYKAYSEEQAIFLLELDGISRTCIIDSEVT